MEKSGSYASKLSDLMTLGLLAAIVNAGLGVHATVTSGMPPNLMLALVFGLIGLAAVWYGKSREDVTVWAGGLIGATLLTPTRFGLIPLVTAIILTAFGAFLAYKVRQHGK